MAIVRTGTFLDTATRDALHDQHKRALNTPVMIVSQRSKGPHAKDEATLAIEHFNVAMNAAAVAAGLPEPPLYEGNVVNYGCDYKTGEILGWSPDEE